MVLLTVPSILKCGQSSLIPVEEPYLELYKLEPWLVLAFPKLWFQTLSIRVGRTEVGSSHEILHVGGHCGEPN